MKTRFILPSIGLVALMAACSNEELVDNKTINVTPDGRPQVNISLSAGLPELGNADTRMSGEVSGDGKAYSWLWKETDVLGGTLFENTDGNIHNEEYQTNYAFVRSDRGSGNGDMSMATFKTLSPVTVGSYMFYHPYNTGSEQQKLGHTLGGESTPRLMAMKAGDENFKTLGSEKDKNFFFTALAKVALPFDEDKFEAEAKEIPLAFTSAYSFLRIDLDSRLKPTSTTDYYKNFTINKVELSTVNEDSKFSTKFTINPQTIAAIQYDMYYGTTGIVTENGALKQDSPIYDEVFGTVRTALRAETYTFKHSFSLNGVSYTKDQEIEILTASDDTKYQPAKLIYELDKTYKLTKEDEHFVLWIPVPAGTYAYGTKEYTFNNAKVIGKGALMVEVYTSAGKATLFMGKENTSITFKRDQANRFARTLIIDDDETNIDLYAFNDHFDVATKGEWDYAVEYIKEHARDFSNKTPLIKLNGDVEIEELPEFKLQIQSENSNKLTLNGEFTLNPEKTILGDADGKQVPTLVVKEGSKLNFAADIKTLLLVNNGTVNANHNVTMQAMTSGKDANLVVAAGKAVNVTNAAAISAANVELGEAAKLNLNGANVAVTGNMTAANKAAIAIESTTASSTNNVTLAPASKMEIKGKGAYTSNGALDIQASENQVSVVTIAPTANNEGTVTIAGKLDAKTFNNNGTLDVKKAQGEGRGNSGAATFTTLTNRGKVTTEAGELTKNYFGGTIDVATLNNYNEIETNGELVATKGGTNNKDAVITLQSDRYALIQLPANVYKNSGRIIIEKPENYCMYTFYKEWNKLQTLTGEGTIEAIITSQSQYEAVLKQQDLYKNENDKFTAWDVINKFYVACDLNLTNVSSKTTTLLKQVVLNKDAKLNVANNLSVESLSAEGVNTSLNSNSTSKVKFTVNSAAVVANADLTVDELVTLNINKKNAETLNVAGTLVNKGVIDTENTSKTALITTVGTNGVLTNEGRLCTEPAKNYMFTKEQIDILNQVNQLVNNITSMSQEQEGFHINKKGDWGNNVNDKQTRLAVVSAWIKAGANYNTATGIIVEGQAYDVWYKNGVYLQFGGTESASVKVIADPQVTEHSDVYTAAWQGDKKTYKTTDFPLPASIKSYMRITNNGTVNLNGIETGYITNTSTGKKNGEFTHDLKNLVD